MRREVISIKKAIEEAGVGDRVTYLSHGETYNFEVPADRSRVD